MLLHPGLNCMRYTSPRQKHFAHNQLAQENEIAKGLYLWCHSPQQGLARTSVCVRWIARALVSVQIKSTKQGLTQFERLDLLEGTAHLTHICLGRDGREGVK